MNKPFMNKPFMSKAFMSKARNPIELIDRYLQAVRFWLPKTQRQDDLIAELGEDLRSQIEEREAELGHSIDDAEMSAILKRCGSPMMVAGRLGPQRYLIGPALFPIYEFVLKMVLLSILVPVFIFIVGPVNLANGGGHWGSAIARTFGDLWSGLFIAAGIVTLVFAIIERTNTQLGTEMKWDPLKLPPVPKQERKMSRVQAVCELVFGFFGLVWLLLLPQYPWLILGPAAAFMKPAPMWHTFYLPILGLAVVGLLRSGTILARPQWAAFPMWTQLVQTALTLILFKFMINSAAQTANGDWHPFVVAVTNSAQYIRVAAIVNASIIISLASAWLGLSIAGVIQTWAFLRYLRKRTSLAQRSAPIGAQ
jgi:hypothetical protein